MRRFTTLLCVAAAGAVAVVPGASALEACNGNVHDLGGHAYLDDRDFMEGGVWLYTESNGVGGLQSGGKSLALQEADPCVAPGTPDTLIF